MPSKTVSIQQLAERIEQPERKLRRICRKHAKQFSPPGRGKRYTLTAAQQRKLTELAS